MAKTTMKRGGSGAPSGARPTRSLTHAPVIEVVDPRWVLNAVLVCVVGAAVCAYLALCLLVYQGSWQLMLKPSALVDHTPAALGLPFDALRFDAAETGTPRLAGWWVPGADETAPTLLVIHDGKGSMAATVAPIGLLHATGANVFAFDFRGFGQSEPGRPSESRMAQDTEAALDYLENTRHLTSARIVPVGIGLGAALATSLAHTHPELPGLILDNPDPNARARVLQAENSRLLPVGLLIREHFELTSVLRDTKQPTLLIVGGPDDQAGERDASVLALYRSLPDPKLTLVLDPANKSGADSSNANAELTDTVTRFLDQYLAGRTAGAAPFTAH